MREELSELDRAWLKWLKKAMWKKDQWGSKTLIRPLTMDELERVFTIIERCELPCNFGTDPYGFFLKVFGHSSTPEVRPWVIMTISPRHIPDETCHGFDGQHKAYSVFQRVTHSQRNRELLKFYRMILDEDPFY